jgi:preprotein translocase subunit SecF
MINWMKFKWLYFFISGLVIIPGLVSLFMFGLKPGIDFTGGSLLEYKFSSAIKVEELQKALTEKDFSVYSIQNSENNTYLLRMPSLEKEKALEIKNIYLLNLIRLLKKFDLK